MSQVDAHSVVVFPSNLGWMGFVFSTQDARASIQRLSFGHSMKRETIETLRRENSKCTVISEEESRAIDWVRLLQRFADGESVDLSVIPVALGQFTEFETDVRAACQNIPFGRTLTYGELAQKVGRPGAARAVGNVMRKNPTPLVVPCHRVVGTQGLGGFSAPQGLAMKERLLDMESPSAKTQNAKRKMQNLKCKVGV